MSKKKNKRVARAEVLRSEASPSSTTDFSPDYSYVRKDLRRIAMIGGGILAVLIALSFILN